MAVVVVSKDLNEEGVLAGEIAKTVGGLMGGGGGGKPHLATAGGKDNSAIDDAISSMKKIINETLNR
jgi:alanyl-tRNA synthetase